VPWLLDSRFSCERASVKHVVARRMRHRSNPSLADRPRRARFASPSIPHRMDRSQKDQRNERFDRGFSVALMMDWSESLVLSHSWETACARCVHREIKENLATASCGSAVEERFPLAPGAGFFHRPECGISLRESRHRWRQPCRSRIATPACREMRRRRQRPPAVPIA
jgi:hypothetical protein